MKQWKDRQSLLLKSIDTLDGEEAKAILAKLVECTKYEATGSPLSSYWYVWGSEWLAIEEQITRPLELTRNEALENLIKAKDLLLQSLEALKE